jgi:NAD+ synthase
VNKYQRIEAFLVEFLKNEVKKAGFTKVVLGISGGVDSAVVAVLAHKAFQNNLLGLMLPSSTSSSASLEHADELCRKFGIRVEKIPVGPLVDTYFSTHQDASKLRIGNFSARMRMAVLYDISARENALVLGTGNKSEILLGYGTIFGDLACAINPIGELYKTEIFEFARYLGVPESIFTKAPSADLWEGQSDEGEFGFTYAQIDKVLFAHVEENKDKAALLKEGFDAEMVDMALNRIEKNRFKGKLPTIADLSAIK